MPITSKREKTALTRKLIIMLTIDASGRVTDAILSKHNLPKNYEELRMKILTMTGWTPGNLNSQNVCCKHGWVISGFKWG